MTASVLFDLPSNIYTIIKKVCLNTVLNEASIHEKSDHFSYLKLLYILIKNIYSNRNRIRPRVTFQESFHYAWMICSLF